MAFQSIDGLRYFQFDCFTGLPVEQAIFTRHGGVSPAPWSSLNVGGLNGDERANVVVNRQRMFQVFGRPVESLYDAWQVHGVAAVYASQPRPLDAAHLRADIILTDKPVVTLFMRFGDCVPIFLYDSRRHAIALAHAGWQGTVQRVAAAAVDAMRSQFGSVPSDIVAGIGPSVCVHHYEVGQNVILAAREAFGEEAHDLLPDYPGGHRHFDLWEANRRTLISAGVKQVEKSAICTVCQVQDWFSHRAEHGATGRFGALFALHNGTSGG